MPYMPAHACTHEGELFGFLDYPHTFPTHLHESPCPVGLCLSSPSAGSWTFQLLLFTCPWATPGSSFAVHVQGRLAVEMILWVTSGTGRKTPGSPQWNPNLGNTVIFLPSNVPHVSCHFRHLCRTPTQGPPRPALGQACVCGREREEASRN